MTHRAEHERLAITRIASILLATLAAALAIAPGRADAAPDQTVSAIPLGATTTAVVPAVSDPLNKYQASYRFGRADGPPFPARSVEGTRAAWAIAGWRNGATGPEVIGGPTTMWRACHGGSVATFKWTAGVFLITVSLAAGCPI